MKVIVGSADTGKSTILFHYVYNEIEKLISFSLSKQAQQQTATTLKKEAGSEEPQAAPHACIITSKRRINDSQILFGIYCEVQIETLR